MNERELQDAVNRLPKSIEPPRDLWPDIEARLGAGASGSWRRRWYWVPLAAAAVLVFLLLARGERSAWDVTALAGRPLIGTTRLAASGRLRVGDWLQTDDSSRALIAVGRIGQVEVRPATRVQLVVASANARDSHRARAGAPAGCDLAVASATACRRTAARHGVRPARGARAAAAGRHAPCRRGARVARVGGLLDENPAHPFPHHGVAWGA